MPDAQIHPLGTEDTPAGYTIPDTAELLLKGAFASFDGTNAAGPYIPLLRVISDAGTVSLEAPSDVTLAAGESADASWFPHLAAAAQAVASSGTVWAYLPGSGFITVPAASGGSPGTALLGGELPDFYTNTPSAWTTATHTVGLTTSVGLAANEPGHYRLQAQMALRPGTGAGIIEAIFVNFGSGTPASYGSVGRFFNQPSGGSTEDSWLIEALFTVQGGDTLPSGPWLVQVSNGTANPIVAFADVIGIQTDTDQTQLF